MEKLFYIQPGADPSKIQVQLDGAKGLKLSKDGEIIIQAGLGDLKLSKPIAWQEKDGKKLPVEVSYKLIDKNRYSFVVAKADPSLPIVIDPILQSTYLGGVYDDKAYAIAIHPTTGDVYVAGVTTSADFPKTIGEHIGGSDAFVSRLNQSLTQIYQSIYLGGSYSDDASAIAINPTTGDVYIAGTTTSDNFSKTTGGAQKSNRGYNDVYVSRLNSDLTQILQSTYLGREFFDVAYAIAIHPTTGDVYVAGYTNSENFPGTAGGAQSSIDLNTRAAFVSRLNSDLTQILQSTYLSGKDHGTTNEAHALAINPSTGDVYVTGITTAAYFPKTAGGAQSGRGGGYYDAFVSRLNSDLTQILQSTYLGGNSSDYAYALAIHPTTGDVYVAGYTKSENFPGTKGGAQKIMKGDHDAFVSRLNSDLTQILQSTYLGGSSFDNSYAIAVHPITGEVYITGSTNSTNFPKATGGAQKYCNKCGYDNMDAFVARLSSDLTKIFQSTYLGGSSSDVARAIAINPKTNDVYVVGYTSSTDFPNTFGGAQNKGYGGGEHDGFVARLTAGLAAGSDSDKKTKQNPSNLITMMGTSPVPAQTQAAPTQTQAAQQAIPAAPPVVQKILSLPPEEISGLSLAQIQAIPPEYMKFLTIKQIQALTPYQIKYGLTPEQVKALSSQQLQALTPEQVKALSSQTQAAPAQTQTVQQAIQALPSFIQTIKAIKQTIESLSR